MASKKASVRRPAAKKPAAPTEFGKWDVVRVAGRLGVIRGIADYADGPREYQVRYRDKAGTVDHRWVRADAMAHA